MVIGFVPLYTLSTFTEKEIKTNSIHLKNLRIFLKSDETIIKDRALLESLTVENQILKLEDKTLKMAILNVIKDDRNILYASL